MKIGIVGAGRTGSALAVHWQEAGHEISGVSGRDKTRARAKRYLEGIPVMPAPRAAREADVVVIGVPDDAIEEVCRGLADRGVFRGGQWVLHLSGATGLDTLASAKEAGAGVLALHPLQTFPDGDSAVG